MFFYMGYSSPSAPYSTVGSIHVGPVCPGLHAQHSVISHLPPRLHSHSLCSPVITLLRRHYPCLQSRSPSRKQNAITTKITTLLSTCHCWFVARASVNLHRTFPRTAMSVLIWQKEGWLKKRNVLGITGTSNLISVIYCVQKLDTGWQRDIDERRLVSEEITVRGIFFPPLPLLSAWISSVSPPLQGIPQLTWDEYSSSMPRCFFAGCICFAYLSNENREKRRLCISALQMQMQFFGVSKCIRLSIKSKNHFESLFWNGGRPAVICMHFNATLPTDVCAERWLRPHSDECPSLPCWDVPSSQTPGSHHAPVTMETSSRAYHPQGPGQGGQQSHINISFHAGALNRNLYMLI